MDKVWGVFLAIMYFLGILHALTLCIPMMYWLAAAGEAYSETGSPTHLFWWFMGGLLPLIISLLGEEGFFEES